MQDYSRTVGKLAAPDRPRSILRRYGVAVLLPAIALLATGTMFSLERAPFFPLLTLATMLSALYGGLKPGLVAAAVTTLLCWLALPPFGTFHIADRESAIRLFVYAVNGVIIALIIGSVSELQRKLDTEREKLHTTLVSIGDAVLTTTRYGRVIFMNPVAETLTGWSFNEAKGRQLGEVLQLITERTRSPVDDPVSKVLARGSAVVFGANTVLIRRDGTEIPIDDSAAPILDGIGRIIGVVLVFRDVSKARKIQSVLVDAEKMATVGRLATTVAHEINNPLEAISNYLYLVSSASDLDVARSYAAEAHAQLKRVEHVTKNTLAFTRRAGTREELELAPLIDTVLSLYNNKILSKVIHVEKRYAPGTSLYANPSETELVVSNLVSNALDALRQNGTLYLRTHYSKWRATPKVELTIADNGIGIPKEHQPRILEAFFTTKTDVGTGLGLWVTKQIIDAHSGNIRIRSCLGKGTVVRICWAAAAIPETTTSEAIAS